MPVTITPKENVDEIKLTTPLSVSVAVIKEHLIAWSKSSRSITIDEKSDESALMKVYTIICVQRDQVSEKAHKDPFQAYLTKLSNTFFEFFKQQKSLDKYAAQYRMLVVEIAKFYSRWDKILNLSPKNLLWSSEIKSLIEFFKYPDLPVKIGLINPLSIKLFGKDQRMQKIEQELKKLLEIFSALGVYTLSSSGTTRTFLPDFPAAQIGQDVLTFISEGSSYDFELPFSFSNSKDKKKFFITHAATVSASAVNQTESGSAVSKADSQTFFPAPGSKVKVQTVDAKGKPKILMLPPSQVTHGTDGTIKVIIKTLDSKGNVITLLLDPKHAVPDAFGNITIPKSYFEAHEAQVRVPSDNKHKALPKQQPLDPNGNNDFLYNTTLTK